MHLFVDRCELRAADRRLHLRLSMSYLWEFLSLWGHYSTALYTLYPAFLPTWYVVVSEAGRRSPDYRYNPSQIPPSSVRQQRFCTFYLSFSSFIHPSPSLLFSSPVFLIIPPSSLTQIGGYILGCSPPPPTPSMR